MDKEIAIALGQIKEQINDLGKRLDTMTQMLNKQRMADIDYIAMEAGIELEQEDSNGIFA